MSMIDKVLDCFVMLQPQFHAVDGGVHVCVVCGRSSRLVGSALHPPWAQSAAG